MDAEQGDCGRKRKRAKGQEAKGKGKGTPKCGAHTRKRGEFRQLRRGGREGGVMTRKKNDEKRQKEAKTGAEKSKILSVQGFEP